MGTDSNWVAVAAGWRHSLAFKSNGTLWAWGINQYGQLGQGNTTQLDTPTQVGTDTDWSKVAAGGFFSVALKSGGTLWAWGRNTDGQLGVGIRTTAPARFKSGAAFTGSRSMPEAEARTTWRWDPP